MSSSTSGPTRSLSVGDGCPECGRVVTETCSGGLLTYCWWCNDLVAGDPERMRERLPNRDERFVDGGDDGSDP